MKFMLSTCHISETAVLVQFYKNTTHDVYVTKNKSSVCKVSKCKRVRVNGQKGIKSSFLVMDKTTGSIALIYGIESKYNIYF